MMDLYGLAFRKVLYPAWESTLRGRPTLAHLSRLERTQWCSRDQLRALQDEELGKLLNHAFASSPHYRRKFEDAGIHPDDIRGVEDIGKLPLLTRDEAVDSAEERKSTAAPLPKIRKMTSGTTGTPLSFAYDHGSEYWRQATKLRGYGWAGYRPGDRCLHFWGSIDAVRAPTPAKRLKQSVDHLFRREHYVNCAELSEAALEHAVREIRERRPSVIVCYAQAGAALARYVVSSGKRDWDDISVICAAERLFPADRAALAEAFGPRIFETYGSREVMLIAAECPAHEGLHVSMENLVVEVIVREGDEVRAARPGELGEVVLTDLHNHGSPFIRYVNGDLATPMADTACGCGRALCRLEAVEGRAADTLRDGAGRPVAGMFFMVLFSVLADKVRQFQVVQRKDRSVDVRIVPGSDFDDSLPERVRRTCARFLPGIDLRAEVVPDIPTGPSGKLRVVMVES
jgi:phenylacetate-coenzyme A ligase PaaK-like adenylate-forming protein